VYNFFKQLELKLIQRKGTDKMKLGKIEQHVIEHGNFNEPECNIVFPDNICPECGHDILDVDTAHYEIEDLYVSTSLNFYSGKHVTFCCPDCGCKWERVVYTTKEFRLTKGAAREFNTACVILPIGIILIILSIIFHWGFAFAIAIVPVIISSCVILVVLAGD
jgi:hypothetical protein